MLISLLSTDLAKNRLIIFLTHLHRQLTTFCCSDQLLFVLMTRRHYQSREGGFSSFIKIRVVIRFSGRKSQSQFNWLIYWAGWEVVEGKSSAANQFTMKRLDVELLYGKYPDLKREYVQQINEWIARQPHLPKISDLEIACFLRATNCSVEAAKCRIDNFYTCRTRISVFTGRDILGDDVTFMKDVM